ncbi:MAG: hypothetical protein HOO06_08670 [Bdellovibrionaceae bacterium]|nr:hypothetical protein [Pseudobdellovibrionaceae bacterium]
MKKIFISIVVLASAAVFADGQVTPKEGKYEGAYKQNNMKCIITLESMGTANESVYQTSPRNGKTFPYYGINTEKGLRYVKLKNDASEICDSVGVCNVDFEDFTKSDVVAAINLNVDSNGNLVSFNKKKWKGRPGVEVVGELDCENLVKVN